MSLWDSIRDVASRAGNATRIAGQKAKLKADLMLLENRIKSRKEKFGVDLYQHVSRFTGSSDFYNAQDKLTQTLRPPLIEAQREIQALQNKRSHLKEDIKRNQVDRTAAGASFNERKDANTVGDTLKHTARMSGMAGASAKLKTDLAIVERQMKSIQHNFGTTVFPIFENLEDTQGWLPTERNVRRLYDDARTEIEAIRKEIKQKQRDLQVLNGDSAGLDMDTDTQTRTNTYSDTGSAGVGSENTNWGYGSNPPSSFATPAAQQTGYGAPSIVAGPAFHPPAPTNPPPPTNPNHVLTPTIASIPTQPSQQQQDPFGLWGTQNNRPRGNNQNANSNDEVGDLIQWD